VLSAKKIRILLLVMAVAAIVWRCSTEKNRFINRSYHNTTAHYNGYFNAREAIKEALKNYRYGFKDNYEQIIPVIVYADENDSKQFFPIMDTSIAKCATVIKRHSMPERKTGSNKNVEWGKWIDDNWMMIGIARFHKREYEEAEETFKYVATTYPSDENFHWSRLWLARTYLEDDNFNAANRVLLELQAEIELQEESKKKPEKDKKSKAKGYSVKKVKPSKKAKADAKKAEAEKPPAMTKKFIREKKLTEAHLYVKSKEYSKAITALEEVIPLVKHKKTKARLHFVLAQIYQDAGQYVQAVDNYRKVPRYNPPYEMAFYAQINQVFVSTGGNTNALRNKLIKLSKDTKNIEYLDIIYYALGELELKEKREEKGINYFKLSANNSKDNKQKSKAYVRLADLYFDGKKYVPAQNYYDSTLSVINDTHARFRQVEQRNKNLTELVYHLNIIHFQDSVRYLVDNFSEKEIIRKIEKIIAEKKREDDEKKQQQATPVMIANNPGVAIPGGTGGAVFWAFDQNQRTQGYNAFRQNWGNRVNEDNWRRSDKTSVMKFGEEGEEEVDSTGTKLEYTVDFYLKNIPLTAEQKAISDSLLISAYYGAGTVYKQGLRDYPEAIKMFEKLTQKYPNSQLTAVGHFNLYLIYKEQNNSSGAEQQKNIIINYFPDSEYAKILSDPNYLKNKEKLLAKAKDDYLELLNEFNKTNYLYVVENTEFLLDKPDTTSPFVCPSLLLRASSVGYLRPHQDSIKAYEQALDFVVSTCGNDPTVELAQNTLDIIRKTSSEKQTQIGGGKYNYDASATHFFVYLHETTDGAVNPVKIAFSDFTMASFSPLQLTVASAIYSQEKQLIIVKTFKSKKEADSFLSAFVANKDKLIAYNKGDNFFIISQKNYLTFYKEKDLDSYMVFYKKNYKK
jgi:tetratricopeptide (TPR) repeat protein